MGEIMSIQPETQKKFKCYVCKQPMTSHHSHYVKMCVECGDFNEQKRIAKHQLSGYIALVTGARVKIGYHTSLRLLRDGATVIATTRFPYDALKRYIQEPDFFEWKDRIHLFGLDFRQIQQVEQFIGYLDITFPYLDIIINNACQSVRTPREEYQELKECERECTQLLLTSGLDASNKNWGAIASYQDRVSVSFQSFPINHFEIEGTDTVHEYQSWIAPSDQISLLEMLEVQLINVTAPFLLSTRLRPMMQRSPHQNRFIVNVTSVEGTFDLARKGSRHTHNNMAKASLNMMSLTLAKEMKRDRIFVNSVDPGWVSSLFTDFLPAKTEVEIPLQFEDAAARLCDPIYEGINVDNPTTGASIKDYRIVNW